MKYKAMFRDSSMFQTTWERFLSLNDNVSVFYTLNWMDYQRHYSEDRFVEDLSFILLSPDDAPLSICPLYLEDYDGILRFSYRGEFLESLRTPLISRAVHQRQRKKKRKQCFSVRSILKKGWFESDPIQQMRID